MIEPKQKIKIKTSDLEKMSQEEVLLIAQQVKELQHARSYKRLDSYLDNAHEGQLKFHKDEHRQLFVLAPNRGGKTTGGFAEFAWCNLGIHPFKKTRTPIKSAIVLQDFETHGKNILEPKMKMWAPTGAFMKNHERHQGGCIKKIYWSSGSTTDVYSHDQDLKVFEGSDYDLVWFDEPPPEIIWTAMWRGCTDRGGRMYMTGTALASPFLYKKYNQWKGADDGLSNFIVFDRNANVLNIGEGNRELGEKRIKEFAEGIDDPAERDARLNGGFIQLSGLIFKNWDRKIHTIKSFPWPHNWPIWESIDPHQNKDWAVSYLGFAPNGAKVLLKSSYLAGVIDEIAEQIVRLRETLPIKQNLTPRIERCLIDNFASQPLFSRSNTDPTARRVSVREELENLIGPRGARGPRIEVCPKNVKGKIDIFKRWLHPKDRNGVMRPEFFVFDSEDNEDFIFEIENYIWDRHKSRNNQDLKDRPVKKNDDILDTVMQICLTLGDSANRDVEYKPVDLIGGFGTYGL